MFSFSSLQSPDDIRRAFNAELKLYNAVVANAIDVAFRLADLNLCAMKQAASSWSEKSANAGQADAGAMPAWLDAGHLKKDMENFASYGQQVTKVMLDLQGDMAKIVQQRAAHTWNSGAATNDGSQAAAPASAAPAMAFIQNMVEQASKGYTQWTSNALNAMHAVETDLAHAADGKDGAGPATTPRRRK